MAMSKHIDTSGAVRPRGRHGTRAVRLVLGLVLAGVTVLAAGCGDGSSDADREDAGGTAAAAAAEAPATPSAGAPDPEDEEAAGSESSEGRVVEAGSSPTVMAGADTVQCIATEGQTGGSYSFLEIAVPAGSGPPPHQHDGADEFFYVLSGLASVETDGVEAEVAAGGYFHVPRGGIHSFKAITDVKLLAGYAPAGDEITIMGWPE
jgi:quercetin dioxygenase-like cupin family protein